MQLSRSDLRVILVTRLGVALAVAAALTMGCRRGPSTPIPPTPATPVLAADESLVTIGRAYSAVMLDSYAEAFRRAADQVEAGDSLVDVIARIRPYSDAARSRSFAAMVSPRFGAIVPDGTPDAQVGAVQRRALARAFREFARGVGR